MCVYVHKFVWSNNSVVCAGIRLCAGPLSSCGSIVAAKCPHWLWGIPTLLFSVCTWGEFLWGLVVGSWTTHLHLVLGLRMCGAVHPLLYLVMVCTRQQYFYARVLTLLNLRHILVNIIPTNAFASACVGIVLIMVLMHILGIRNYLLDYHNAMKSHG